MSPEELKNAPKTFVENIRIGFSPEYFIVGTSSGKETSVMAMTPGHAKRLKQYLEHEIAGYEKTHGTINTEWSPNIVSPVQRVKPAEK